VLKLFTGRLPSNTDIMAVFAGAVFMVYSWTLYWSFYKIPSWLMFLDLGGILSIYAYAFIVNFLESVLLLSAALIASIVLPQGWWKKWFVPKGFVLSLIIVASAQIHMFLYRDPDTQVLFLYGQGTWWFSTLWVAFLVTWMVGRIPFFRKALIDFADRLVVFLYIYMPLTIVALLIVLVRVFL